jgi:hypothetical protein
MFYNAKNSASEKDQTAAANAPEVVGRTVQQQRSVVEQPPPKLVLGNLWHFALCLRIRQFVGKCASLFRAPTPILWIANFGHLRAQRRPQLAS